MRVNSGRLRLSGHCDVVEFRADPAADSLRFYQLGNHYKSRVEHVGLHPEFAQDEVLLL